MFSTLHVSVEDNNTPILVSTPSPPVKIYDEPFDPPKDESKKEDIIAEVAVVIPDAPIIHAPIPKLRDGMFIQRTKQSLKRKVFRITESVLTLL